MEWTEIDYMGTIIEAADFLDGVLVDYRGQITGWQGWYVCQPTGDMNGPALRRRRMTHEEYEVVLRGKR